MKLDEIMHLWKICDTFQTLGLEYGHDGFDNSMVVATQRLVFEDDKERFDNHVLEVVISARDCVILSHRHLVNGSDRLLAGCFIIRSALSIMISKSCNAQDE